MNITTRTYYVAQNIVTLKNVRNGTPSHPPFDTSSKDTVQQAWDAGHPMRCLDPKREYIRKGDIPNARVLFTDNNFGLYVEGAQSAQLGNLNDHI